VSGKPTYDFLEIVEKSLRLLLAQKPVTLLMVINHKCLFAFLSPLNHIRLNYKGMPKED